MLAKLQLDLPVDHQEHGQIVLRANTLDARDRMIDVPRGSRGHPRALVGANPCTRLAEGRGFDERRTSQICSFLPFILESTRSKSVQSFASLTGEHSQHENKTDSFRCSSVFLCDTGVCSRQPEHGHLEVERGEIEDSRGCAEEHYGRLRGGW